MLIICERYAKDHGIKFFTESDPKKSKTKCLAFLQADRVIRPVKLCNLTLPWVTSFKHQGNTIRHGY